ncbi:MAG: TetR/AcrR family transcriptional regulator [Pseudomonadota bacterium]
MSSANSPTREKILKAAWQLLEPQSGSAARMSDIAKAAGVSRQALYLHFPNRTELFIETTKHMDAVFGVQEKLMESRTATTGEARLDAYIRAWLAYVPKIFGIAKTLTTMAEIDVDAAQAWDERMADMKEGCAAAIADLVRDGRLAPQYSHQQATDVLWAWLSITQWELLVLKCGWSQARYVAHVQTLAHRMLVAP